MRKSIAAMKASSLVQTVVSIISQSKTIAFRCVEFGFVGRGSMWCWCGSPWFTQDFVLMVLGAL